PVRRGQGFSHRSSAGLQACDHGGPEGPHYSSAKNALVEGADSACQRWAVLRILVAGSVLLVYTSYWFVMEPPQAHAFYVLAPVAFLFAAFWWTLLDSPRARQIAAGVLVLNLCFHAGLAWAQAPEISLYRNRAPV